MVDIYGLKPSINTSYYITNILMLFWKVYEYFLNMIKVFLNFLKNFKVVFEVLIFFFQKKIKNINETFKLIKSIFLKLFWNLRCIFETSVSYRTKDKVIF